MIGRVIGTYKIQQKLGEGGMGAVYKGVDTMLDREVAIKALKPELASQTAIVERFRTEAVTLAKLHHPNIATLYSLFRQGDELYMVLEYVRGQSLDEILARRGALDADEVIPVFCQILDGINHAHEYGIIHRDIKPANMMLTENGTLKVLDFGIARLLGSDRMTRAGNVIGTLEYMAPEQVKGLETDARSDTYALGMMLYEMLTGRAPFDTENEFELMKLQTESYPPEPRTIKPGIPESVEAAIMRAIQKDPDARFQTAGEFRESLLDAGFAERGVLRRGTDPGAATPGPISTPPVSKPETAQPSTAAATAPVLEPESLEPVATVDDVPKETRFVPPADVSHAGVEIKETRLGESLLQTTAQTTAAQSPSFLASLTWIHYAVATFAVVVLIGGLLLVPIAIFSSGFLQRSSNTVTNTNTDPTKRAATVETPTPQPVRSEPVSTSTPEPRPIEPVAVTPVEPKEPPKTSEPRQTRSGQKAAPPPPRTSEPAKKPAKRKGSLRDARCALTGDC